MKKSISNSQEYEAYLNELFNCACTTSGTPTMSMDDALLAKAMSYGRTVDEAKEDVKRILNVRGAVSVVLKSASAAQYKSA